MVRVLYLSVAALLLLACGGGQVPQSSPPEPQIEGAWLRMPVPGSTTAAGYLTLHNPGDTALTVTGLRSDAFEAVEIHEMLHEDGMMRMRPLGTLVVAPGESVELRPHGLHLMLMRPIFPLQEGSRVAISMHYEQDDERRRLDFDAEARMP